MTCNSSCAISFAQMRQVIERCWKTAAHFPQCSVAPILSVFGPSGAGKTTVAKILADGYPVFIETTKGNPYLADLLTGSPDFKAAENQRWFLNRVAKYIGKADPKMPLVLDQDPAGIVFGYARMFLEDGKMTQAQYESLIKRLLKIEETLQKWGSPRVVLFLDAPAEVLRQRILSRSGKALTPPLKWFERVRNQFLQIFSDFPNAFTISTDRFSADQVTAKARMLIEKRIQRDQQ